MTASLPIPGILTAEPVDDYDDVDSAKDVLELGLRAWEAHSEINEGIPFQFRFTNSNTETADEHGNLGARRVAVTAYVAWAVEAESVIRNSFPGPDAAISVEGPVTSLLRSRWRSIRTGHEHLPSWAYWLLTIIERAFGPEKKRREGAARKLQVDFEVLDKVGCLTSVSDPEYGRKVGPDHDPAHDRVLTGDELGWLQAAGELLIRRVLEYEAGVPNLPRRTMDDLPALGPMPH